MRRPPAGILALIVVVLVGGCSAGDGQTEPPKDAITVVGMANCTLGPSSDEFADREQFECELDFSDPRVNGTESLEVVSRIADIEVGGPWTAEGHIVTDSGEWRGAGQGVVGMVGVLPHAEGIHPANFGEMRYEGEGDLEGLTLIYYFAGSNNTEGLAGWITED
jgi:hypothetical protein